MGRRQSTAPGTLSGGRLRFGRWVPGIVQCRKQAATVATPPPLPVNASRMLRAYNASRDDDEEQAVQRHVLNLPHHVAARQCNASTGTVPRHTLVRPWRCDGANLGAAGVQYLVGVHTTPGNRARRDAIRSAWARYPTNATLVCFVIGLGGLPTAARQLLDDESATHADLALLPRIDEGTCHLTIAKAHAWWVWAADHRVPFTLRVDDDTFLHIPTLEDALAPLHCHARLCFGLLAYVGYNPVRFTKCMPRRASNYGRLRRCRAYESASRLGRGPLRR